MKNGSITTHPNQKDRQLNGQQPMKAIQSDQKLKRELTLKECYRERGSALMKVIAEVEAYFKSKDKSFYEKSIKKLEERSAECITLEGKYLDN
ncbi:hypothetical protein TNCV_1552721 [Trichonephila clavipes]|nr:hypothetical protein TNCV_1552721 [Trichonephila clavipes]